MEASSGQSAGMLDVVQNWITNKCAAVPHSPGNAGENLGATHYPDEKIRLPVVARPRRDRPRSHHRIPPALGLGLGENISDTVHVLSPMGEHGPRRVLAARANCELKLLIESYVQSLTFLDTNSVSLFRYPPAMNVLHRSLTQERARVEQKIGAVSGA